MINPPQSEMTMRDYVAAQVMAHMSSAVVTGAATDRQLASVWLEDSTKRNISIEENIAIDAFAAADAFLRVRNQ